MVNGSTRSTVSGSRLTTCPTMDTCSSTRQTGATRSHTRRSAACWSQLLLPMTANGPQTWEFVFKWNVETLLPLFARSHAKLDGLPPLDELLCFYGPHLNDAHCF